MASDLLGKWLDWWQPLRGGLTGWGAANGLILTGGWFWARTRGGFLLYRGFGGWGRIDWERPVGASGCDAREVREFGWMQRGSAGGYWYGVRAVGPGGMLSPPPVQAAGCGVDENGSWIGPLPGDVERVWALSAEGGRVLLSWCYGTHYESMRPSEFRIYHDGGTGQMDYNQPVAAVAWDLRRPVYSWLSGEYGPGEKVRFGVRAASAAGEGGGAEAEVVLDGNGQVWPALMLIEEQADGD